jgi:hypothetical protein
MERRKEGWGGKVMAVVRALFGHVVSWVVLCCAMLVILIDGVVKGMLLRL